MYGDTDEDLQLFVRVESSRVSRCDDRHDLIKIYWGHDTCNTAQY
jgi:hypothetical protein